MDWTYQFVVNRFLGLNQCEFLRRNQANTLCGFFLMSLLVFFGRFQRRNVPFYMYTHDTRRLVLVQVRMISAIPVFIGSVFEKEFS